MSALNLPALPISGASVYVSGYPAEGDFSTGLVMLSFEAGVAVRTPLRTDEARELAQRLLAAADHADRHALKVAA